MKAYLGFLKNHYKSVFFGWLLTFFSSFGQTFFVSLFVPGLLATFAFSKSAFGAYYAVATIVASFFLLRFGHVIDERPVRPFTYKTLILLAISCIILGFAIHPAMVFVALIGLRLGGQGLMSHISQSVMSRYFDSDRGKALSIASLGYGFGEMLIPVGAAVILAFFDWRIALFVSAGILLLVLLPVLHNMELEAYDAKSVSSTSGGGPEWSLFLDIMNNRVFWILALPLYVLPFTTTGLFFYQYVMAEARNWPLEWYALCFTGYAVTRLIFSLYGGVLNDRFTARGLFPFYLLPFIAGLLCLAFVPGKFAALLFLTLTGVSMGISGIVTPAAIAEMYGVERIGQIKSLFSVGMVISTAIGPMLFGFLLDNGTTFSQIAWGSAIVISLVSLHNVRIKTVEPKELAPKAAA